MKTVRTYASMAKKITFYIDRHLQMRLTIRMIAEHFRISDYTLKKIFRTAFGQTVHEYIREKRLLKARRLLLTTDLQVKHIAGDVGFRSVSAFLHSFSKRFSITPTALRDQASSGKKDHPI